MFHLTLPATRSATRLSPTTSTGYEAIGWTRPPPAGCKEELSPGFVIEPPLWIVGHTFMGSMTSRSIDSYGRFGDPLIFNRDRIRLDFHPFSLTGTPREDQSHEYHFILHELGADGRILQDRSEAAGTFLHGVVCGVQAQRNRPGQCCGRSPHVR